MIIKRNRKFIVSAMIAAMLSFVGCAGNDQQMEEVIQSEGSEESLAADDVIEASELAAEEAADQMEEEYGQQEDYSMSDSEPYYAEEDDVEDTGALASEDTMIDAEPTYADEDGLSYSDDAAMEIADNEDDEVDFNDSSADSEPTIPVAPVEEEVAEVEPAPYTAPMATPASTDEYIVQPGDNLSSIALKLYGNAGRWQELASLNSLGQEQTIYPGDKIRFDSADSHASDYMNQFNNSLQTVTVEKGDSLYSLSERLFNNGGAWKYLYQLNADTISNPNQIFVGQVLNYHTPQKAAMTH